MLPVISGLFRNANGASLSCFVQADAPAEKLASTKKLLVESGAEVVEVVHHALVILVDPATPGSKPLLSAFADDPKRAIVDFNWVHDCLHRQKCLGPQDSWGGHKLPVTDVNTFFGYTPPTTNAPAHPTQLPSHYSSASPLPSSSHTLANDVERNQTNVPHGSHRQSEYQDYAQSSINQSPLYKQSNSQPAAVLSSQVRAPSPTFLLRPIGTPAQAPSSSMVPSDEQAGDLPTSTSPNSIDEPTPPPVPDSNSFSAVGVRYRDNDNRFIIDYCRWYASRYPGDSINNALAKIGEKMHWHTVDSIKAHMRRQTVIFGDLGALFKQRGPRRSSYNVVGNQNLRVEQGPVKALDPLLAAAYQDEDGPPPPPTKIVKHPSKGNAFTPEDDIFLAKFFNWYISKRPDATRYAVFRAMNQQAPHHPLVSWQAHFVKNMAQFRASIPSLEYLYPLSAEESGETVVNVESNSEPLRSRKRTVVTETPSVDDDELDDEAYEPHPDAHSPSSTKKPRKKPKALTSEERQALIQHLADCPWIWTKINPDPKWDGETQSALATWKLFENKNPERSLQSWREFHRRYADQLEREAHILRRRHLGLETNIDQGPVGRAASYITEASRVEPSPSNSDGMAPSVSLLPAEGTASPQQEAPVVISKHEDA
ncbi:hypothetical protein FRC03_010099 [Tulasnella sp. 419]|nr:hypothetical protein FRC02_000014 [Tulasnella sp. 418]KAG8967354.1 hypothetical protein FRC03_010099 [Tulasnella sp. 419]